MTLDMLGSSLFQILLCDLVKLWNWNSRLFQQITLSSAILLCSLLLSSLNEKIKNISLFSVDGKDSGFFFFTVMKGVSDTIWESTGIQTSILLNPDSYISFTGCHCQFTKSSFFWYYISLQWCCKDTENLNISTSFPEDLICLGMSDSKQCSYSLTFSHSSLQNKVPFRPSLLGNFK